MRGTCRVTSTGASPLCSRADTQSPRSIGSRPAGDHRQWQWLPDGLVSILHFWYGLNVVHVDSRRAHVHRATFPTEDDMAKKAKKAKKTAKAATKKVAKKTSKKKK
jgi:hypothetical protein